MKEVVGKINLDDFAKTIDFPIADWKGNCALISQLFFESKLLEGDDEEFELRTVYGKFLGKVSENSIFADSAIPNHSWLITKCGLLIDPTRWVFEDKEPYIYVSKASDLNYDRGSNSIKTRLLKNAPEFNENLRVLDIEDTNLERIFFTLLQENKVHKKISIDQYMWVVSQPLNNIKEDAYNLFNFGIDNGLKAFIPLDHFEEVMEW